MVAVQFLDEARAELVEALEWYGAQSPQASDKLLLAIEATLDRIATMPRSAPRWPGIADVHHCVVQKYPYAVVYLLDGNDLHIVAIAHAKRRPGYWASRLR